MAAVFDALSWIAARTDALAWVVVALFLAATALAGRDDRTDRVLTASAWSVFAVFWGALVPHFAFVQRSIIEGVLSAAAVPACLYVAYLAWQGRRDFQTLTQSVAFMGLIYLPFQTITALQQTAIETTTRHVEFALSLLGYTPPVELDERGYRSVIVFMRGEHHRFTTHVLLACTGIGSMAIVAGLVAAVKAPVTRRLQALAVAAPIIYALNVMRVTFIALAHAQQWFRGWEGFVYLLFGKVDQDLVSYMVADRVIAQSLSVVALVALTLALLRIVPELAGVVEDVLYVATGNEYDVSGKYGR